MHATILPCKNANYPTYKAMTKLYTAKKVLEAVLEDVNDDQDYDDPDEPVMEGSDEEFSDLELNEDDPDLTIVYYSNTYLDYCGLSSVER